MSTKRTLAPLLALAFMAAAAHAGPHRSHAAPMPIGVGYQGEASQWSFACMKDHGPTDCGEPIWIYGN